MSPEKNIKPEIKKLLVDELNEIKHSRISIVIGFVLMIAILGLIIANKVNPYSIIFQVILFFIVKNQIDRLKLSITILHISRYIVDDDYQKVIDNYITDQDDKKTE